MIIAVERENEKMTVTVPTVGATEKKKSYFVDGAKASKDTTEIVIRSYVQYAIETGATIEIDTRLANEFKAIAATPYKGEFALIYTDKDGKPVEVAAEQKGMFANSVDTTPYHVEIKMYGDKTPIFEMLIDGRNRINKRGGYTFRKSEVDEWIMKAYMQRKQYPNMTFEVPEVVAVLHLDSFATNPRFIRELNVTLTGFEMKGEPIAEISERQINEYAIIYGTTAEAIDAATTAEIELAKLAADDREQILSTPLVTIDAQDTATDAEIEAAFQAHKLNLKIRALKNSIKNLERYISKNVETINAILNHDWLEG